MQQEPSLQRTRRETAEDIWKQLTGTDVRILEELDYLSGLQAAKSPTSARYCTPGRNYIAAKVGCSVWTVSRHITKLKSLGMLRAFQRRPIAGRWQTNLYHLVRDWVLNWTHRVRQLLKIPVHRVLPKAHIAPEKGISSSEFRGPAHLAKSPIIKAWMERGKGS